MQSDIRLDLNMFKFINKYILKITNCHLSVFFLIQCSLK